MRCAHEGHTAYSQGAYPSVRGCIVDALRLLQRMSDIHIFRGTSSTAINIDASIKDAKWDGIRAAFLLLIHPLVDYF